MLRFQAPAECRGTRWRLLLDSSQPDGRPVVQDLSLDVALDVPAHSVWLLQSQAP